MRNNPKLEIRPQPEVERLFDSQAIIDAAMSAALGFLAQPATAGMLARFQTSLGIEVLCFVKRHSHDDALVCRLFVASEIESLPPDALAEVRGLVAESGAECADGSDRW